MQSSISSSFVLPLYRALEILVSKQRTNRTQSRELVDRAYSLILDGEYYGGHHNVAASFNIINKQPTASVSLLLNADNKRVLRLWNYRPTASYSIPVLWRRGRVTLYPWFDNEKSSPSFNIAMTDCILMTVTLGGWFSSHELVFSASESKPS